MNWAYLQHGSLGLLGAGPWPGGSGERNLAQLVVAVAYLAFVFLPESRKKLTARLYWLGWSAFLIARLPPYGGSGILPTEILLSNSSGTGIK